MDAAVNIVDDDSDDDDNNDDKDITHHEFPSDTGRHGSHHPQNQSQNTSTSQHVRAT